MKLMFLDVETTSLDPTKGAIWQLTAWITKKKKILSKLSIYMKVPKDAKVDIPIPDVKRAVSQEEGFKLFKAFLDAHIDPYNPDDKLTMVAYNEKFDTEYLRNWFVRMGDKYYGSYMYSPSLCMMQAAAAEAVKKGNRDVMKSFKLKDVAKHHGIKVNEARLHDSDYDVELTYKLFCKLFKLPKDGRARV